MISEICLQNVPLHQTHHSNQHEEKKKRFAYFISKFGHFWNESIYVDFYNLLLLKGTDRVNGVARVKIDT